MAILDFQRPDKVYMVESTETLGNFEFRPLEPGYGLTIGNALRRVLLSSLEGFAITSVKIEGVKHEFSTIKGVAEDVTEMILNLKQIRLKQQIEDENSEKVSVKVGGSKQFTAADIGKSLASFQVLNPDLVICNMEKDVTIEMELTIEKGRGYVPAEVNKKANRIARYSSYGRYIYTNKERKYSVENFRVEQKTDYEKLVFQIETDGSIHPQDALTEAAKF